MPAALLRAALAEPTRGLVLEAYGAGTVPDADRELLAALAEGARAASWSPSSASASTAAWTSAPTRRAARWSQAGAVGGLDMTTEAAYAKLVVLLSEGRAPGRRPRPVHAGPRGRAQRVAR